MIVEFRVVGQLLDACRKRFGTESQYLRHLADDVLPGIIKAPSLPRVRDLGHG